jgi:hypothetical protein
MKRVLDPVLVVASTFPVAVPFIVGRDANLALPGSARVATTMALGG